MWMGPFDEVLEMGSCWARKGHGMGHVRCQVQFTTQ